jgi:hypothetical protein
MCVRRRHAFLSSSTPRRGASRRSQAGQMCVELAMVVPVAVVVALIVFNLSRYVEACATFDRVALDCVIAQGVSPPGGQTSASAVGRVRQGIQEALDMDGCEVSVVASGPDPQAAGTGLTFPLSPLLTRFTCTLRYRPWPHAFVIAGVAFAPPVVLTHVRTLVVDRYRPGVVA